jgi:hypothetical protein
MSSVLVSSRNSSPCGLMPLKNMGICRCNRGLRRLSAALTAGSAMVLAIPSLGLGKVPWF